MSNINTRVLKFGGAALAAAEGLRKTKEIIAASLAKAPRAVAVVSAFDGIPDKLDKMCQEAVAGSPCTESLNQLLEEHISFAHNLFSEEVPSAIKIKIAALVDEIRTILYGVSLINDISPRTADSVLSRGSQLSAVILHSYLSKSYPDCQLLNAAGLFVAGDKGGAAYIDLEASSGRITKSFEKIDRLAVIPGGIAASHEGNIKYLGIGGSDYSASIISAAVRAEEIELWTTVNGLLTADPQKVRKAFAIPNLSYEEAMELCHFGARVIYPRALQAAQHRSIPVRIKNILQPELPGSLIQATPPSNKYAISGISSINSIALIRLQGAGMVGVAGTAKRLFEALTREGVSIVIISQASSEHSICVAIDPSGIDRAQRGIEEEFAYELSTGQIEPLSIEPDCAVIAVVGSTMRKTPGISGRLFQALGKNGINVTAIAQGSSELNISVVISGHDEAKALNALHDAFFLSDLKTINLFLIGTGQVGCKLLEQMDAQMPQLRKRLLDLKVVALANSRQMLVNPEGISPSSWKEAMQSQGEKMNLSDYVQEIRNLNLPNSIFVDCSASENVAQVYPDILRSSISIVTPNKKANSGRSERYDLLKQLAAHANVKFFYETNVGAGLPIIGTLNDLLLSGDKIVRIEAILSGTLSYIFNSFNQGISFSAVVKKAQESGYTEPDPRDDLSGTDVARKLLILAREIGLPLELEQVQVESLIPENCVDVKSVPEFFAELVKSDQLFEERRAQAESNGKVLRYIGSIENGQASVSLQAVDKNHPFYSLSGSDNIIMFVTNRYLERPLVVKGPGAGTEVTAAGVLADIVRAASYSS